MLDAITRTSNACRRELIVMLTDFHPTDQELLQAADGELPSRRAAQIRAHLASCWNCRARMAEVEGTIAEFVRAHHQTLDSQLPPISGPRALLVIRLRELAAKTKRSSWRQLFQITSTRPAAAYLCLTLLVAALVGQRFLRYTSLPTPNSSATLLERGVVPDHSLTPGSTRRVSLADVCSMAHEEVVREVPTTLRQQIFHEYGIVNPKAADYEIDFLIAPGLGGAEDIHNLWPQAYTSGTWNARVKDALEERLHQMVCAGKLDLSVAQSDIANDWIAAYKKYFHTDKPLALRSEMIRCVDNDCRVLDRVSFPPPPNGCSSAPPGAASKFGLCSNLATNNSGNPTLASCGPRTEFETINVQLNDHTARGSGGRQYGKSKGVETPKG
jgi:Putative zinc-finger